VRIRRDPQDDHLHPLEDATNFNESRYYNFYDAASHVGGWVRMGNRPNEGYAEMTTCFYLPTGSVAFMFGRPEITGNEAHDAGGLRFDVLAPYEHHRVRYDGQVIVLEEPERMAEPREAFRSTPRVGCTLELDVRAIAPAWGGEPEPEPGDPAPAEDAERSFARGHTEQHIRSEGVLTVGDQHHDLRGALGVCDHSWGPRYWQAIWWYRWLTVNLGPDLGFVTTLSGTEGGARNVSGFLYDRRTDPTAGWVPIRDLALRTTYDAQDYQRALEVVVTTDRRTYEVTGEVWSNIPLRNRRNGLLTRIAEGMTTWRCEDLVGSGLAEYLDQVVDGVPVGRMVA
jgi:hypothetical protein